MEEKCPKCGSALEPITVTATGRQLQRCTKGSWNKELKKAEGCDFVKWIVPPPEKLDEKCPKCGSPVVQIVTRFGKKLKKCSTNIWNKELKKAEGCDYVEWFNGTSEELKEDCPKCGKPLILFTTSNGKNLKKCSTAGWDRVNKSPTGCTYVEWLKAEGKAPSQNSQDDVPPDPTD